MRKIIDYIDTPSVRVFQTFAGESLENLNQFEVWDIITVLCQALSDAHASDFRVIATDGLVEMLNLEISDGAHHCLKALNKFPENQVNALMKGLLEVAFEDDLR
jgi:hypothetical protein